MESKALREVRAAIEAAFSRVQSAESCECVSGVYVAENGVVGRDDVSVGVVGWFEVVEGFNSTDEFGNDNDPNDEANWIQEDVMLDLKEQLRCIEGVAVYDRGTINIDPDKKQLYE